jgi:hypothetical protein
MEILVGNKDNFRIFHSLYKVPAGILGDEAPERNDREYCRRVLQTYSDLKKEDWIIGIEGGDYIYSFDGNFIFITDGIWNFNLIAKQPILELLAEKMKTLKLSGL